MTEQLDSQGEARDALSSVVNDYSKRVLSDPRMLGNLVTDLLPDQPRERSLLVTAAEADVAGDLTRHVEEHHLDPDTAVQMVSRALSDRRALDPAASAWVTATYARALGYNVRSAPPPAASAPPAGFASPTVPPTPPPYSPTVTTYGSGQQTTSPQDQGAPPGGWPGYSQPPSQPPSQPQAPGGYPPAPGGYPLAQGPAAGGGYPPGQGPGGGGGYPPGQGGFQSPGVPPYGSPAWQPPTRPTRQRNRWPIFAGAGTAVVVVFVIAAFAGGLFGGGPTPKPSSSPTVHPPTTHISTSTSSSPPPVTTGVADLNQLLPSDLDDPSSQCSAHTPKFTPVGLVKGVLCNDPGLPNGSVEAFQMSSFANYQKSWANFNKWWGFTSYTPGSACPPTGSNHLQAEGTTTWYDNFYPTRQGQVLECEWTGTGNSPNDPSVAWTFPTENAFIVAWGGDNEAFADLQDWWKNGGQPLASPTPAPPSS
jgi:hypothetical protein